MLHAAIPALRSASSKLERRSRCFPTPFVRKIFFATNAMDCAELRCLREWSEKLSLPKTNKHAQRCQHQFACSYSVLTLSVRISVSSSSAVFVCIRIGGSFDCGEGFGWNNFPVAVSRGRNFLRAREIVDHEFANFDWRAVDHRQSLIYGISTAAGIAVIVDCDAQLLRRVEWFAAKRQIANPLSDGLR